MLTAVEKLRMVLDNKNIKVSKLESALGWGNGYLNPKRMKNLPSDRLQAAAEYLNMSVNEILTYGDEKTAPTDEDGFSEKEKFFMRLFRQLPADRQDLVIEQLQGQVLMQTVRGVPGE